MFKRQSNKKLSNHNIVLEFNKKESNFKNVCLNLNIHEICAISINKINELNGLPKKSEHIRIVTKKAINTFDFIQAICSKEIIIELTIAVYRVGKKVVNTLNELHKNGDIKKITILLNDGFPKFIPETWNLLKSIESDNFVLKLENNHTKILLMRTKDNYYCVEGSGNMSINARIEQYCFDNNKKIYDFHYNWITKI